ncbi:hypothetical protein C8Q79DRAFT_532773 [Trametes meyenii]|nr:hypothetical protein C8Q79DRAFT_532773 [Trametes meyenii]
MKAIKRIFNHQNRASAVGEKKIKRCSHPGCGQEFAPRDQFDQFCPRCLTRFSQPTPSRRWFPQTQSPPQKLAYVHTGHSERRTRNVSGPSPPEWPVYGPRHPPLPAPQRSTPRRPEEPYYSSARYPLPVPGALNVGAAAAYDTPAKASGTWRGRRSSAGHTPGLALRELPPSPVALTDSSYDMSPPAQHYHHNHDEPRVHTAHQQGLYTVGANRSALVLDTGTSLSRGMEQPQLGAVNYVYGGADHTGFPICIPVPVPRPQPSTQGLTFNTSYSSSYATSYAAPTPARPPFVPYAPTVSRPSGTSRRGPRPRSNSFGGWQWPTS